MPSLTEAVRTSPPDADSQNGAETVLIWRVHRLRENPKGVFLVATAYGLAFLLWRLVFPQPLALVLPVFALTGALSDYLFPTTYKLTTLGAHADCGASRLFIAWDDVKRATSGREGVYLSPFSRPSRLDSFRGVRLRFAPDNGPEVTDVTRQLWRGRGAKS